MIKQIVSQTPPLVQTFQGEINGEIQPLVNARDLHIFLESKQQFGNWIVNRIEQYGFVEGQDYLLNKIIIQLPSGAKYQNDYHITLDMAKELSMVERNAKGKQARQYFIACEKALHQVATTTNDPLTNIAQNMQVLADGMQVLAQASQVQLRQLDRTQDYINLLELNQKGSVKVTPEIIEQVKLMKQGGYSQANIARMLRISGGTVSQIINDKYPMNAVTRDSNIARMVQTAKSVLEQGE